MEDDGAAVFGLFIFRWAKGRMCKVLKRFKLQDVAGPFGTTCFLSISNCLADERRGTPHVSHPLVKGSQTYSRIWASVNVLSTHEKDRIIIFMMSKITGFHFSSWTTAFFCLKIGYPIGLGKTNPQTGDILGYDLIIILEWP